MHYSVNLKVRLLLKVNISLTYCVLASAEGATRNYREILSPFGYTTLTNLQLLVGPTFASGVFQLAGKEAVFLVLSVIAIIIAGFVVFVNGITVQKRDEVRSSMFIILI